MTGSAIAMMAMGMVILWGGLAASIIHAIRKAKQKYS